MDDRQPSERRRAPARSLSRRRLLAAIVACVALGPRAAFAHDTGAAATAAVEISRLEAARAFDALYDRMHPAARAIIPRRAVVGWYVDDLAAQNAGELTVTRVRFVDWTWPVTGVTYPGTAAIDYVQPFFRASRWVEEPETVHLVAAGGEWRWFFGRSRAFVDEQIARYAAEPAVESPFALTDLGPVDGLDISRATAINDPGWVAGNLWLSTDPGYGAFLRRDGRTVLLGPSPESCPRLTGVKDMNDAGQIVGGAFGFETPYIPYVWQDGVATILGLLPDDVSATAAAINNGGQIVGYSSAPRYFTRATDVPPRPVRFEGTEAIPLPLLDDRASGRALAINDAGVIAGVAVDAGHRECAALWRDDEIVTLGALPGDGHSAATAINGRGDAVGDSAPEPLYAPDRLPQAARAFLARAGAQELIDLGRLGEATITRAQAINDAGWIVGASGVPAARGGRPETRAFLWRDGRMEDLNDLIPPDAGWRLTEARAINAKGQIAGAGVRTDAARPRARAFLLTPTAKVG